MAATARTIQSATSQYYNRLVDEWNQFRAADELNGSHVGVGDQHDEVEKVYCELIAGRESEAERLYPLVLAELARLGLGQLVAEAKDAMAARWAMIENVRMNGGAATDTDFIMAMNRLKEAVQAVAAAGDPKTAGNPKTPKPKRHRRKTPTRRLSSKQIQAMQAVGENKGNIAEAARSVGVSRQSMTVTYSRALAKVGGIKESLKLKTQRMPEDSRGQANVGG